jgi:tetratricopeptide (TPR) repeat protein
MLNRPRKLFTAVFCAVVLILFAGSLPSVIAQSTDPQVQKIKAKGLMDEQRMTEALPIYEELAKSLPNDREVFYYYGFALLGQAANVSDEATQRSLRIRARAAFSKAKELGDSSQLVQGLIDGIPPDGSPGSGFSDNAAANRYMEQGEAAFSTGKLDDALAAYQNAFKMDPQCYYAALFSGDVHSQKGNFSEAMTWYKRAIKIDPYKETAYRYSATPLMKQGKYDEARDLYIEAFVTEPYNRLAVNGIIQWGQATNSGLGHPKLDIPKITIGPDGKTNSSISVSSDPGDGSLAWMSYVTTREEWQKTKFAKQFPGQTYRHTLAEETDALRSVVVMATSLKPKKLNEQIALIAQMDKDGVLESYVLMAIPDKGIAQDHRAYLIANRDKLKKYVLNYVIAKPK